MTEEGLPQVSSKLDNSFPYSYPSVSYPGVFTTNAFPQISPELGHSPIPIHVFSRLVSEKEKLIPQVPPSIYLQVSDEAHCTIDNSRNYRILQTERRIVCSKILSNMSEMCTGWSGKNIYREASILYWLILLEDVHSSGALIPSGGLIIISKQTWYYLHFTLRDL